MSDLGKKPEVIDYIETFTWNTDSCYAVFSYALCAAERRFKRPK